TFLELLEAQRAILPEQVLHYTADLCRDRFAVLDHRDVDYALGLAARESGGGGNVRLQEARIEGTVVDVVFADAVFALGQRRQCEQCGQQTDQDAFHVLTSSVEAVQRDGPVTR